MNIFLKPFSNNIFKKNAIFNIEDGTNAFYGFKNKLKKKGININTLDLGKADKGDVLVFCDIPYFWEIGYWKNILFSRAKKILFCFESPPVNPFNQIRFLFYFFDLVFTWNDDLVDGNKVIKFFLPVLNSNLEIKEVPFRKKKLLCLINSNKSLPYLFWILSSYKENLYLKRIEAITFFEKNLRRDFDLYGKGWNRKNYPSYKGTIKLDASSKVKVMSKYKFSICFENCVAPGYISEKIMDCFKAHVVPIYLGAPNISKYISNNSFIDFRDFRDFGELLDFITNMSEKKYLNYIKEGKELLKNKNFKELWFEEGFEEKFLEAINL